MTTLLVIILLNTPNKYQDAAKRAAQQTDEQHKAKIEYLTRKPFPQQMTTASKPKTEAAIQSECVIWFKNTYPQYRDLLYMNNNNSIGGRRGSNALAMGLTSGIPDTFLALARGRKHGAYPEFKRPGEGLSDRQKEVFRQLEEQGYAVWVIDNLVDFQIHIRHYLSLSPTIVQANGISLQEFFRS